MNDSSSENKEKPASNSEKLTKIIRFALELRYINLIAVASSFVGAICMSILAMIKTIFAVKTLIDSIGEYNVKVTSTVTAFVVQAMDASLMSLVLVVFATGIFHLFIRPLDNETLMHLPGFKIMSSIVELKKIIAELIIVVLFVQFLKLALEEGSLDWTILIIPAGILLMATSLRLLRFDKGGER
jgi:uncharacterized membrane protein YqhA